MITFDVSKTRKVKWSLAVVGYGVLTPKHQNRNMFNNNF